MSSHRNGMNSLKVSQRFEAVNYLFVVHLFVCLHYQKRLGKHPHLDIRLQYHGQARSVLMCFNQKMYQTHNHSSLFLFQYCPEKPGHGIEPHWAGATETCMFNL